MSTNIMIGLISLITLITVINGIDSNTQLNHWIVNDQLLMCFNKTYKIPILTTHVFRITFNRTRFEQRNIQSINLLATIIDRKVLQFQNNSDQIMIKIDLSNDHERNQTIDIDLKIKAKYLNRTLINYNIKTIDINEQIDLLNCSVEVLTLPPQLLRTKIFLRSIPFIVIFISIQMGILLDIVVLKELVHRPIAVAIGFICQYGLMPMIAFTITKIFQYPPLYGFGLFAVGCCPGGSTSNQLTVIFDGDINLSVLMSFVSTLTSFLMMPIWFYTLGNYAYLHELKIIIPFQSLMRSLATTVVSLSIGMIIVYFFPKLKPYVHRIVKPVSILLLFYFFIFGTYVNFYLFAYINLRMALTTPLLPWVGYILGGVVAWIFQQDWIRIKTIGIETGIQNVGIAFLVLLYSLPEPENHQSTVIAMIVSYISSQPFYIILLIRFIRKKCFKKKEVQIKNIVEVDVKLKDELENSSKSMIKFHQEVDHDLQKVPLSSIV